MKSVPIVLYSKTALNIFAEYIYVKYACESIIFS